MILRIWTVLLFALLCATAIAWFIALMREKSLRPVRELAAFLKRHSVFGRVILCAFFIGMCVYGSTKSGNGGGGDDGGAKPSGGMGCGDGARHVDVKSRGESSGDGAPAVAGGPAATDSRDGGGAVATLEPVRIGADGHSDPFATEARVTAEGRGRSAIRRTPNSPCTPTPLQESRSGTAAIWAGVRVSDAARPQPRMGHEEQPLHESQSREQAYVVTFHSLKKWTPRFVARCAICVAIW